VFDDVDMETAMETIAGTGYYNAGRPSGSGRGNDEPSISHQRYAFACSSESCVEPFH
jgi:hypothetical protein